MSRLIVENQFHGTWLSITHTHTHTHLTALFPGLPGEPVPER